MALLTAFWEILAEVAPYLLLGFALAGLMSILLPVSWIRRHLGGSGPGPVVKAAAFGIPLPICSCGVIPLAASLRERGASVAATLSFLVATPQTSIDSIILCAVLIGPWFAVASPATALLAALLAGVLATLVLPRAPAAAAPSPAKACCGSTPSPATKASCCGAAPAAKPTSCCASEAEASSDAGCQDAPTQTACCDSQAKVACGDDEDVSSGQGNLVRRALQYGFVRIPDDIGLHVLVGLVVAAAIAVFVPPGFFSQYLGNGLLGKLAMVAAAVPVYVCSTSSVPVVASLVAKGVSPGTALVFFIAGPATNAATIATVARLLGRRAVFVYLSAVVLAAVGAGFLLDALGGMVVLGEQAHAHEHLAWWQQVLAVALLLVLVVPTVRKWRTPA